ncbi:MAG TPA: hypothetical protein VN752_08650 [Solirubrobacterales bacterium]|nr:hypothetical protein [Solirubrobacterales bacterium]
MDLLRNLFGNLTSGIIRLAVTAGVLFLVYLFLVKPVLDTTNEAIKSTGLDRIGKSLDDVGKQIKRQVHRSFEAAKPGAKRQRLVNCIQRAEGDVQRIQRCTRRF